MWQTKSFSELSTKELFEIYRLRVATFVVAQQRIYQEVDEQDLIAQHVFYQDDQVAAYARVFKTGDHVTFGRVVTDPAHRGIGMGTQLMNNVLAVIRTHFPHLPVEIEAQTQVADFYKKFDFQTVGKPFIFESTPHIKMTHAAFN
ncbi:GNAT family N-acetyltransferase [Secundilactobacillus folii]|uniref:GNAT family N-acetyltransferase n=1 Tax=Secundilactobacillus folii TaxID=2678357 RepID=A0A7X2XTU1_9LACO|nr:GNAT family N-acetyltransferase [Secundilactobacillus folii]MTV81453.1 GNAT family N-acetyltransferase [Secundilactobacillus folii]